MRQRGATTRQAPGRLRMLTLLVPVLAMVACKPDPAPPPATAGNKASCLPAPTLPARTPVDGYRIYLDRSLSMSGYVQPALGPVALPDILTLLAASAEARRLPIAYWAFGRNIAPLADAAAAEAFTAPAAYDCAGKSDCDNQESLIDKTLSRIAADRDRRLSIVVTDLWLDHKSFRGTLDVALGGPLRRLLDDGKAVGLLGIDAPYAGPVYDVPHVGTYAGATRRPLFVLLIGSVEEVGDAYALLSSRSPLMRGDAARYALFTAAPIAVAQSPELVVRGGGIVRGTAFGGAEQVPELGMNLATATSRHSKVASIVAATPDGTDALRPGLRWNGRLHATSRWWRLADGADLKACKAGMWEPAALGPAPWRGMAGNPRSAVFALDSSVGGSLSVPGHYFMLGEIGVFGLYPNPAADWMRDWSLDDDEAAVATFVASRPTRFKALKLASIAKLMNDELVSLERRPRALVRFPLVLTMRP